MKVYTVLQAHREYRSFCDVYSTLEKAEERFEELVKYFEQVSNTKARDWTTKSIPSQIKVLIIDTIILYLCEEEVK